MVKTVGKKQSKQVIAALDVGTSKVVALIAEVLPEGKLEVIGLGSHPASGLKRGVVVNIEATVQSIQQAVEEAELMAGCEISEVYTGIAGSHIRSLNSHGIVAISEREVAHHDIEQVIDAAKAVAIPADQRILHVLPQEFIIDNQGGIREPVGMSGVRLEAKVHMVTGAVSAAQNIVKCVQRCGLEVSEIILQQLASSHATLSDDEKELGVCLVDIGGGTTDIAVYTAGGIRHTAVIPIAGDQVTNDIAVALRTPAKYAETIKQHYASAAKDRVSHNDMIDVPSVGDRPSRKVARRSLAEVVEARYDELLALVQAELRRSGFEDLVASGLVFTGGGSQVDGLVELAEQRFRLPTRIGYPQGVEGLTAVTENPKYATAVGLLLYANQDSGVRQSSYFLGDEDKGVWQRMKAWFQGNF